ncbi:hypothetical protein WS75_01710 [Burkholderia sp. FL-7-2-10-S1-D7]|nr:hypothetical protein WS75_01710 [Burkholderia sp. FL-7-2-10-S1-D7]
MVRRRVKPAAIGCALARRFADVCRECARTHRHSNRTAHPGPHADPVLPGATAPPGTPFQHHREPTAYAQCTRGQTMQI